MIEELAQRAAVRTRAYRAMVELLSEAPPLERIAQSTAIRTMELLCADGATVTKVASDCEHLVYISAVGDATALLGQRTPIADSLSGQVLTSGQPRIFDPATAPLTSRLRAAKSDIKSGIIAPIWVDGMAVGTLGVTSSRPRRFSHGDLCTLADFTKFVAFGLGEPVAWAGNL